MSGLNKQSDRYHFGDFTETEYREILRLAKGQWTFIPYERFREPGKVCLWRHDVDFSTHRALKMATIEGEEGVQATYFIHLHSAFYHPLDPENADRIRRIISLGHDMGLHFDARFYQDIFPGTGKEDLAERIPFFLLRERELLETTFQCSIRAFSLHNPDFDSFRQIDDDEVEGMVNAYSRHLRDHYAYVSDSNGYWRFSRLKDILETGKEQRLHVLTHPGWWTPDAMSPRDRISRCIEGRARNQHRYYDRLIREHGRKNIGKG